MGGVPERPDLSTLELTGPRLLLRRWRPEDAARVAEVMTDESTARWLSVPWPYTRRDAEQFVSESGHDGRDEGTGLGCAVEERETGRVVGSAALRLRGGADIGYWIAADARGHGYATEAATLLGDLALGTLGLPRVRIDCDTHNLASARTALAAGFRFEGIARAGLPPTALRGGPRDRATFARLPDDPRGPIEPTFPRLPAEGITDGELTVRPSDERDTAALVEADADPLTRANGFGGPPPTPDDLRQLGAPVQWLVGWRAQCSIVDAPTGRYLGGLTVRRNGPPGVGVLGYLVHPAARGRGVTGRALRLIAPWLLAHGFHRLELGAKIDNIASQRAALAGGFRPDGVMRGRLRAPDGTYHDEARFYLLAD